MKKVLFFVTCFLLLSGCHLSRSDSAPSIKFIKIPPADEGGPGKVREIEGTVTGARAGQKIILYARSGIWWIQPFVKEPFTEIQPDSTAILGLETESRNNNLKRCEKVGSFQLRI